MHISSRQRGCRYAGQAAGMFGEQGQACMHLAGDQPGTIGHICRFTGNKSGGKGERHEGSSHCGRESAGFTGPAAALRPSGGGAGGQPERAGRKAWAETALGWRREIWANRGKRRDAKPQGLRRKGRYASLAAEEISKPLETVGRKAMGAKVRRRYASPAAGYFASDSN